MILADEGLNGNLVKALREDGYQIMWIKETAAGMADEDIIVLARQNNQILITEDKDFGEWIFAHQLSGLTIIFLRYDKEDYDTILSFLRSALKTIESSGKNEFITINKNKVRRRRI
jgi:predicted nuclease of predicted toxin-antitoxin system